MSDTFLMNLLDIQPSQLYISEDYLKEVMESFDPNAIEPITVFELKGKIIFTDDHEIALAAHLHGVSELSVCWDEDDLHTDAYAICVDWCIEEGVRSIADLKERVVSNDVYDIMWVRRCDAMLEQLGCECDCGDDCGCEECRE